MAMIRARKDVRVTLDLLAIETGPADHDAPAEPPKEFRVFARGLNTSVKGDFLYDDDARAQVLAAIASWGNRYPFDFNHSMLKPAESPDPAEEKKSAGQWTPEDRDGELWATAINWTPYARSKIANREYVYFSPAFDVDKNGRVKQLTNVALTNLPAINDLESLVACDQGASPMDRKSLHAAIHECHAKIHGAMHDDEARKALDARLDRMSLAEVEAYHSHLAKMSGAVPDAAPPAGAAPAAKVDPADGPAVPAKHDDDGAEMAKHDDAKHDDVAVAKHDDAKADKKEDVAVSKEHAQGGASTSMLLAQIAELQKRDRDRTAREAKSERTMLLSLAVRDGKITPADAKGEGSHGAFLATLSTAQLSQYVAVARPLVSTSEIIPENGGGGASRRTFQVQLDKFEEPTSVTLTKVDIEVMKGLGIDDPTTFAKTRAIQSKNDRARKQLLAQGE